MELVGGLSIWISHCIVCKYFLSVTMITVQNNGPGLVTTADIQNG